MPVTLKVAGSWSGQVEIPSLTEWTVCELRAELSHLSGIDAGSLKIICGGRTLKDEAEAEGEAEGERGRAGGASTGAEETVAEGNTGDVGKGNSEGNGEGEKGEGKGTGNALGKRKGGRGRSLEEVGVRAGSRLLVTGGGRRLGGEIAAEGKRVVEEEAARKEREERLTRVSSLVSGLLLHSHSRALLSKGTFVEALPVLEMAEEAFSICDAKITESIDNIPMLLLDIVADESLASLAGMGFSANEARRALRVAGGDVSRAAEFVILQRQREAEKAEEDRKQRRMEREQRAYGRTPHGKKVDMRLLDELAAYGFMRRVAAEALRQSENHHQRALDALLDPSSLAALEVAVAEGKADGGRRRRYSRGGGGAGAGAGAGGMCSDDSVAALVALGFSAQQARQALEASRQRWKQRQQQQLWWKGGYGAAFESTQKSFSASPHLSSTPHTARQALEASSNDVEAAAAALLQGEYGEAGSGEGGDSGEGGEGEEGNGAGEGGAGGEGIEGSGGAGGMDVEGGEGSEGGSEGSEGGEGSEEEERDEEMEGEIRKGVSGDPYAEYDLDVSLEAAAIEEYSKLIIGTGNSENL
ncbi:unnamed protein product [Closterium sp. Naga37s-1]|nr:unnamed protein product [Closterium sp. Naga37s-1]